MRWIQWLLVVGSVAIVVGLLAIAAGQAGLLRGRAPADLGVQGGRLKAPSATPNSVSSQAALWPEHRPDAAIEPLALLPGGGPATLVRLQAIVRSIPGATVVTARDDYLYAQFTTPLMKYTDDVEFWLDPARQVVQVRSASRIGHGDMGLNRRRVEALRAQLAAP